MLKLLVASLLLGMPAMAQEAGGAAADGVGAKYETTVRGSSFQSTSRIVIDEATIKKSKAPNIGSLLAAQANISIASTNVQPNAIFLRGGDSSHILILVDGIPAYDASTIQKTTNLNNLDIKSIRRIEVLKGPQSVLYGGQALAGVIKIETIPLELKDKSFAAVEAGNSSYAKGSAAVMIANEEQNLALIARLNSSTKNTISPIKNSTEKYLSKTTGGDVAFVTRGNFTTFVKASQINEVSFLPQTNFVTGLPTDASNYEHTNRVSGVSGGISMPNVPAHPRLLWGYQNAYRTYQQPILANDNYGSDLINVRLEADAISNEDQNLLIGGNFQRESFVYRTNYVEDSNTSQEYNGYFAKWSHDFGSLFGYELGIRQDKVIQEDVTSYQVGLTLVEKLKLEYATGFKPPSLMQKFGMFKTPNLKSENSTTYSLTYEDRFETNQNYSVTLFHTSFKDLITYKPGGPPTFLGSYTNVSESQTRGIEGSYSIMSDDQLRTTLNLGYQEPRDVSGNKWLIRRPLLSASLGLHKDWEKNSVGAEAIFTGTRFDRASNADRRLGSRTVLNLNYAHKLDDNFALYARGNNVTDQKFEQTSDYYDEGFFGLVGVEIQN